MATKDTYLSSLMSSIPDIDKANPFEVQRGLDYELVKMGGAVTNETVKKALDKAVKNVMSNPNYYTDLLEDATYELLGIKKPNRKKASTATEMEEVKAKDNKAKNQMEKPKVVKESVDLEEKRKNPTDYVIMDVPLFIRMLEFAREDATSDMDLHDVAEKLIKLSAQGKPVTMKSYDAVVANDEEKAAKDAKALKEDDWKQADDESDMAHSQLKSMMSNVSKLMSKIDDGEQLDAWVQAKLTKSQDYLQSVYDYLCGEEKQSTLGISLAEAFDASKFGLPKKITTNMWDKEKLKVDIENGKITQPKWFDEDHEIIDINTKMDMISFDKVYQSNNKRGLPFLNKYLKTPLKLKTPEEAKGKLSVKDIELTKENIDLIKKIVKEVMLKKGNSTMVATNPNTINLARKQGYQTIPGTEDAK